VIHKEVREVHLDKFPEDEVVLKKFLPDFEITWAKRTYAFNTELSLFFLKPLKHITHLFGFEQEVLLAVSAFTSLEARTLQAIDQSLQQLPAKGRVEQTVAILVSSDQRTESWLKEFAARNPQSRAYVGMFHDDLVSSSDSWYLRNKLQSQLFSRDLFDYTLPIDEDLFFFGRASIIAEHIDAIAKSENRGLFGLRKTGKTSLLFKLVRQSQAEGRLAKYYDCKAPFIYRLSADEFLDKICEDIAKHFKCEKGKWKKQKTSSLRFFSLVEQLPNNTKFCLVFDEIEYISNNNKLASHWRDDYIPFWQSLWSTQSQQRKFSFIIAGVNASLVETDKFDGVQNPLFGIIKYRYLTGFEEDELHSLLTTFGRRMGLKFDSGAVTCLFKRYGGHPLLTRMICSQLHNEIKVQNKNRPVSISSAIINSSIRSREDEISFYCKHITSELEEFYPFEFEMLEMLSTGSVVDFNELAQDAELVRHLKSYGLVDLSSPYEPKFRIPVIQNFIAMQWKRRNSVTVARYVVPVERRLEYIAGRTASILRDLRSAEKRFGSLSMPVLYEGFGPSEAELFASSSVVITRDQLVSFLNQCNRSLVEPIDRVGKKLNKTNYFFNEIKNFYPKLWDGLNRVRSYRNYFMHLSLIDKAEEHLATYLDLDFGGEDPHNLPDGMFRIQSAVLDGLIISIQAEIATYD